MLERRDLENPAGKMQILIPEMGEVSIEALLDIKKTKEDLMLSLLWHYGFMQGFLSTMQLHFQEIPVIRCDKKFWDVLQRECDVYENQQAKIVDLSMKKKDFEECISSCNDEIVFVQCNRIDNLNERRAKENLKILLALYQDNLGKATTQRIVPVFFVEVMLPQIVTDKCLMLDFSKHNWGKAGVRGEKYKTTLQYVKAFVDFVMINQQIIRNMIEMELESNASGTPDYILVFRALSKIVAFFLAGKNYGEQFQKVICTLDIVISEFEEEWENGIEDSDFLEIFRLQVIKGMESATVYNRKGLSDFSMLGIENSIFQDSVFYYFQRNTLEGFCMGELHNLPFVRILKELEERGFLKTKARGRNNLTAVVNLLSETGDVKTLRFVAISKAFFDYM